MKYVLLLFLIRISRLSKKYMGFDDTYDQLFALHFFIDQVQHTSEFTNHNHNSQCIAMPSYRTFLN